MFKQRRYDLLNNTRSDKFRSVDIRPCSYAQSNDTDMNDTPIKLLSKTPQISIEKRNVSIQNDKKTLKQFQQMKELRAQNEKFKAKINELSGELMKERETNLQLLKQNNSLMEEMQKMRDSNRSMEKRLQDLEMMKTISHDERRSSRLNTEEKHPKTEEMRKKMRALIDYNPEMLPFHAPLMSQEILTERNTFSSANLDKKRSASIGLLSKNAHSVERKPKFEEKLAEKQGISLLQKKAKTKIVIERKYIFNR